jgi:hypothetical protein
MLAGLKVRQIAGSSGGSVGIEREESMGIDREALTD